MGGESGVKALVLSCCLSVLYALSAFAGNIPQVLNYNGTLSNAAGAPVPDGNYSVTFRMYNVKTGGTALWTEKWDPTTSQVIVKDGYFNAMLGAYTAIPLSFFTDHPVAYLGVQVGTDSEMLPRQQITSVGYAFQAYSAENGVPKGGIIMWSGTIAQIPAGWALCDGVEKTRPDGTKVTPPNLKDKFILGAGGAYPAPTGGNANHTHAIGAEAPGTTASGDHGHHIDVVFGPACVNNCSDGARDGSKQVGDDNHNHHLITDTQGAGNHAHTVASHAHSGATGSGSTLPPYYALAFIMKL